MPFSVNFKKYEKTPADISASHTLEVSVKEFGNRAFNIRYQTFLFLRHIYKDVNLIEAITI